MPVPPQENQPELKDSARLRNYKAAKRRIVSLFQSGESNASDVMALLQFEAELLAREEEPEQVYDEVFRGQVPEAISVGKNWIVQPAFLVRQFPEDNPQ